MKVQTEGRTDKVTYRVASFTTEKNTYRIKNDVHSAFWDTLIRFVDIMIIYRIFQFTTGPGVALKYKTLGTSTIYIPLYSPFISDQIDKVSYRAVVK